MIKREDWVWLPHVATNNEAHCVFRLTTKIGNYVVCTVGDKVRYGNIVKLDSGFRYSTKAFGIDGECPCGCPIVTNLISEWNYDGRDWEAINKHNKTCNDLMKAQNCITSDERVRFKKEVKTLEEVKMELFDEKEKNKKLEEEMKRKEARIRSLRQWKDRIGAILEEKLDRILNNER